MKDVLLSKSKVNFPKRPALTLQLYGSDWFFAVCRELDAALFTSNLNGLQFF